MKDGRRNPLLALALLLSVLLSATLSRSGFTAMAAAVLLIISWIVPPVTVDRVGQAALAVVLIFAAVMVEMVLRQNSSVVGPADIGPLSRAAALGFLAVSASRFALKNPVGKDPVTAGILFLAVLSMGAAQEGMVYPTASGILLLLLVFGAGYLDPLQHPKGEPVPKQRWATLLVLGTAAAIFILLIVSLPRLYRAAFGLIEGAFSETQTGFGYGMRLGDLAGMQQSDATVMRIRGKRVDYLRGAVYARYAGGQWLRPSNEKRAAVHFSEDTAASENKTEIQFVGGDRNRFFLPLMSNIDGLSPGRARMTRQGILTPEGDGEVNRIRFALSSNTALRTRLTTAEDLLVPEDIRDEIRAIALTFAEGSTDAETSMMRLTKRLKGDFSYSLTVQSREGGDPIRTFLTTFKRGNCEFFASALALMARTLGIPTRVVGGYRVHEYNPLGGYYIVREKNAHAWVEAYLPGRGWTAYDPTPPDGELSEKSDMPFVAAVLDTIADRMGAGFDQLGRLTALQLSAAVVALLLIWFVIRTLRAFRKQRSVGEMRTVGYRDPPPSAVKLLARLSVAVERKEPHEPLERYVMRLRTKPLEPSALELVELLSRYVDWRFADRGSLGPLARDIDDTLVGPRDTSEN